MNPVGAIIVACFAVLWVAAGANQLGRWFLPLLSIAILISAGIVIAATKIPFGADSGGFDGKIYGIFVTLEVVAIVAMSMLPERIWAPVVGIGCALILWLSALGAFF